MKHLAALILVLPVLFWVPITSKIISYVSYVERNKDLENILETKYMYTHEFEVEQVLGQPEKVTWINFETIELKYTVHGCATIFTLKENYVVNYKYEVNCKGDL